jgi:hypothetical protein
MGVIEEQRRAELVEEPGCFPSQLSVRNSGLYLLELNAGVGIGRTIFGRRKVGRASAVCEADVSNELLF